MKNYLDWVKALPGTPVFVAYPAGFDFMFVYWYLVRFTGESPFSHSAVDVKTYAMALLNKPYRRSGKAAMPIAGSTTCRIRTWRSTMPSSRVLCFATCWRKTKNVCYLIHGRRRHDERPSGPSACGRSGTHS